MTTATTTREWRISLAYTELRFSDNNREDMREAIRTHISERVAKHISYLMTEATGCARWDEHSLQRMNNIQRLVLNASEFFTTFDAEFDRQVCGNSLYFDLKTGDMHRINIDGLVYEQARPQARASRSK